MNRRLVVACMAVGMSAWARAAAPATAPASGPSPAVLETLARLAQDMDGDDWRARESAQAKVVELGIGVLGEVERLARVSTSEEVRFRMAAAAKDLKRLDPLTPTRVSIHMKSANPKQVIDEIVRQSKVTIRVWPEYIWQNLQNVTVNIDAEDEPFWLVLRQVCDQTGLSPERMGSERAGEVTLQQRGAMQQARAPGEAVPKAARPRRPVLVSGPYVVMADSCVRVHDIDYSKPGNSYSRYDLQVSVLVDPKIRVMRGPSQLKLATMDDEKGNSLMPANAPRVSSPDSLLTQGEGSMVWRLQIPLAYRPDGGKRLHLVGEAMFEALKRSEKIEAGLDLSKELTRTTPMGTFTLRKTSQQEGGAVTVEMSIAAPAGKSFSEPGSAWTPDYGSLQKLLRVEDDAGRAWTPGGGGGGSDGKVMTQTMQFMPPSDGLGGKATRVVWEIPVEMTQTRVPVEFTDLVIP